MNSDDKKPSQPPKKVFDVARPGKTPAHAASRPVVGSRHTVRDMDIADRPLMNPKQKVTIAPISPPADKAAGPETPPEGAPNVQVPAEKSTPPPAEPQEMPSVPPLDEALAAKISSELGVSSSSDPEQTPEPPSVEPQTVSTPKEPPTQPLPQQEAEPPSEPLHMGMPHDLSQDGSIVVSHHRKRHTFLKELLATVVIVALIAAIANLLLDAGIIATELNLPHTDFFQE